MLDQILLQLQIIKLQIEKMFLEIQQKEFKKTIPNLPKPVWLIVHHGGGPLNFVQVNELHKTWKMPDGSVVPGLKSSLGFFVGYQWFIERSGKIYQARLDNEEGAHTRNFNKSSIGICLQGNLEIEQPTEWQLARLKELVDKKKLEYGIANSNIEGHRHFSNTSCPGENLYSWLTKNYPNV